MDGSKDASAWENSSASRTLNVGGLMATSSSSLGLVGGGVSMEEEVEEDEDLRRLSAEERSFDPKVKISRELSLREWLDKPGRSVDIVECLHIFRQVAEAVNLAHSQGVVVNNVRPSCFVLSAFNRVSFIESASCSSSGSDSSGGEEGGSRGGDEMESRQLDVVNEVGERREFPLKKTLAMEFNWYTSPEEAEGEQSTFASDIYKLGVLLFELFCMFETLEEKLGKMLNLRHRVLPPQMLLRWPKEASFCLWLLHPLPSSRPKMSELLQSEFLNEKMNNLEEREAAVKLKEEIEEQELLLDFLLHLQRRKQEAADKLQDTICFLCSDIEEVENQRSVLMTKRSSLCGVVENNSEIDKTGSSLPYYEMNEESSSSGSRKRIRPEHKDLEDKLNVNDYPGSSSGGNQDIQEKVLSKSSRIRKNFKKLEAAYFLSRSRSVRPASKLVPTKLLAADPSSGSTVRTEGSSVNYLASNVGHSQSRSGEWVNPFLEGLCKFLSFSKFRLCAEARQGDLLSTSNLICSLAFDRDKDFFATAGVNKKIKVFECNAILNDDRDIHYPMVEIATRSKLSNLCWNGYIKSQIASSDFEGVVQVWDAMRSELLVEMREHEKRVWSVDYSLVDPTKLASGSDDGTVKLWNINQAIVLLHLGGSICTIRTKANVCSVQFAPNSACMIAVGSADHNVYCFDLRNTRVPLCTLVGHARTVSYVKFVDSSTLVSSSTDNSLKLWDLSSSTSRVLNNPIQTFTGHTNVKNFVGLSISDGYIATGSETNEFGSIELNAVRAAGEEDGNQFISCVCWRGQSSTLIAANSTGSIRILQMV
ncbi:Protein SPA1-like 3 [Apostasia shenzhenica]|uniref:Protein SPA1-like 3 n=1 Tax=Apostasia shenzhenica TaxID=1088818 RepID=A0A2I0B9J2_9ASPA|nr:Protein SPA1-like 3 [Apostasia shenzhenica]